MAAYIEQDSGFFTRRGVVVGAILLLHLVIVWALVTGLANRAIEAIAPPVKAVFQPEDIKNTPPPPPPPPTFERPPVEIPPTDTIVEAPVAVATTAISNTTTQHVAAAPAAKVGPKPTAPKIDQTRFPHSEDYYPAASKRLEEQGAPVVHTCIAAKGGLSQPPTISTSSGSPRLDEGAINLVKAGARYIAPGTEEGKPVDMCFDFRVKFTMPK
jgi:periplasmic protein TonB